MATYEQVLQALRNADASGNLEDARRLAEIADRMRRGAAMAANPQETYISAPTPSAEVPVPEAGIRERLAAVGPAKPAPAPSAAVSRAESLAKGLVVDPIAAVAQLVGDDETRKRIAEREQQFQQEREAAGREGFDWFRLVGNIGSTIIPGAATAKAAQATGLTRMGGGVIGERVATGVAAGVGSQVLLPVTQTPEEAEKDSIYLSKLRDLGFSGAVGGVVAKIGSALTPQLREGVREQMAQGVRVTPGMAYEGIPGWVFRQMENFGFGPSEAKIRNSFTRAAGNEALRPIGETIPDNITTGKQVTKYIADRLDKYYDDAFEQLGKVTPDAKFAQDLESVLQTNLPGMSPKAQKVFTDEVQANVIKRYKPAPAVTYKGIPVTEQAPEMSGQSLKSINKYIKGRLENLRNKTGKDNDDLKNAFEDLQNVFNSYTSRIDTTGLIAKADEAWANLYRIADAASSAQALKTKGSFGPLQLSEAVNRQASMLQAGTGQGPMAGFAREALDVLGPGGSVGGNIQRTAAIGGKLAGGGALFFYSPPVALSLLAAAGVTYPVANALLKNPSALRRAVDQAVQKLGPTAVNAIVQQQQGQ